MGMEGDLRRMQEFARNQKRVRDAQEQIDHMRQISSAQDLARLHDQVNTPLSLADTKWLEEIWAANAEAKEAPTARRAVQRIRQEIESFEASLDDASEVGVRLVAFGGSTLIRVSDVGFYQPNLVILVGTLEDASPARLVQHLTQLSFMLVCLPRAHPEEPRRPIGFHQTSDDSDEGAG